MNTTHGRGDGLSDVDRAAAEVRRAERALTNRSKEAKAAGGATLSQTLAAVRPVVVGVVAVAGVVWLVSLLRRSRRRSVFEGAPRPPSVLAEVARTAALSLASTAARRLGDRFFAATDAAQSSPLGRAGAPRLPSPARP